MRAILPYFLDSNVLIGYYFSATDTWGYQATKVFEDSEKNYTSSTVIHECFGIDTGGKCQTMKQSIVREFRRAIAQLTRDPSPDHLLANAEGWKIFPILKDIMSDPTIRQGDVRATIRNAMDEYDRRCEERLQIIQNPVHLSVHRRTRDYPGIWQILNPVLGDPDDMEVILDAHDLAETVLPLYLYTGDARHISSHRKKIVELTKIAEIRYLGTVR